jgi:hypothetical protein
MSDFNTQRRFGLLAKHFYTKSFADDPCHAVGKPCDSLSANVSHTLQADLHCAMHLNALHMKDESLHIMQRLSLMTILFFCDLVLIFE